MPRTANWSCSELQAVACRRTEPNSPVQFSSVQFVDIHWALNQGRTQEKVNQMYLGTICIYRSELKFSQNSRESCILTES
jgi:hypothetical protein